jgi:hypothetical protein
MPAMAELLLKRATAASGEVYDVLSGSRIVGRILLSDASPASQWVWTVSYGYHEGRTPTHGMPSPERPRCRHSRRVGTENEADASQAYP